MFLFHFPGGPQWITRFDFTQMPLSVWHILPSVSLCLLRILFLSFLTYFHLWVMSETCWKEETFKQPRRLVDWFWQDCDAESCLVPQWCWLTAPHCSWEEGTCGRNCSFPFHSLSFPLQGSPWPLQRSWHPYGSVPTDVKEVEKQLLPRKEGRGRVYKMWGTERWDGLKMFPAG